MSDTVVKTVMISIQNVLRCLPSTLTERLLTKVPNHLRRVNEQAYEACILSIGPYQRGKDHLAGMEELKFSYLKLLLQRRDEKSLENYVEPLSNLNERAKQCYEERVLEEIRSGKFLEIMLVDGCFIVELFRKGATPVSLSVSVSMLLRKYEEWKLILK